MANSQQEQFSKFQNSPNLHYFYLWFSSQSPSQTKTSQIFKCKLLKMPHLLFSSEVWKLINSCFYWSHAERESFHIPSLGQSHQSKMELLTKPMGQETRWGKKIRALNAHFDSHSLRSEFISPAALDTNVSRSFDTAGTTEFHFSAAAGWILGMICLPEQV